LGLDSLLTRAFDLAVAASFVLLAARAISSTEPVAAVLPFVVAVAFAARRAEARPATPSQLVSALPSLAIAGLTAHLAGPATFRGAPFALAGIGALVTLGALASLGRSFAVLPGVRKLQTRGLYRLVRHPMYLGELFLFTAAASALGWRGLLAAALLVPALAWRITVEERLLRDEPGWHAWAAQVRCRLLPGLW
jgi:protein-S-isoprenylcysteine O-methyltransferase Ste14